MKRIIHTLILLMMVSSLALGQAFITTWKTDNPGTSGSNQITLPLSGSGYNFDVNWGDGNTDTGVTNSGPVTHTYSSPGTYTVSITGDFPRMRFNSGGDKDKILTIEAWGDIEWQNMDLAFAGCFNLTINAADAPDLSNVTSLISSFAACKALVSGFENWNVSTITDLSFTFFNSPKVNCDLSGWDVSHVTTMSGLFGGNSLSDFNGDISGWDVSQVTNMSSMFSNAEDFNVDISNWNVGNVTTMQSMFFGAKSFNRDIGSWDVGSVENMSSMFTQCTVFNQDIGNWNTSKVKFFNSMFYDARDFNQNIGNWNTSSALIMNAMFFQAFDFNQDISGWNTSNVTNMRVMFYRALAFDQDISNWNTSNVTITKSMFFASPFNQDISSWDVSKVTDMDFMFAQSGFDQDLSNWDVSSVTTMVDIFDLSGLSSANYDKILNGWSQQTLQENVVFGAEGVKYCAGSAARQSIIDTYNWTITDGGKYCVVNIPDANFKAYLLASGINAVADGEITYEEAESLTGELIIRELSIADLTGIEAFVNMTSIDCYGNNLTTLDLSSNVALTAINCRNNLLTSLNVSGLINLNNLDFSDNLLTSIDVSSLTAVNYIGASGNQLTSIDVSNNLNLEDFGIYENPLLTSIDISANSSLVYLEAYDNPLLTSVNAANGNNEIIEIFDLRNNPSLTCITVDDVAYSTANWTDIDVTASFSTDCRADNEITFNPIANQFLEIGTLTLSATSSSGLPVDFEVVSGPVSLAGNTLTFTDPGTATVKATQPGDVDYKAATPVEQSFDIILVTALPEQQGPQFKFYPNPVDHSLIVIPNGTNNHVSLQDVQGRIVTNSESKSNEAILLDVSALPLGMYILRLSNEAGVSQTKILKK